MAGEPKKVGELVEAAYKDNLMIPVSDPDIPDGPAKDSFRINLGAILGKGVNNDWDVTPVPSLTLAMTDLHNATFAGGVLSSDFDALPPGFAIGVGKTNLTLDALTVGQQRLIGVELTTVPAGPATQIVGVLFAPSTKTAAAVAADILALFQSQPVTAPFIFQYIGYAGSSLDSGAFALLANDSNPSGAMENFSFTSGSLVESAAIGDRSYLMMSRRHVMTPSEQDDATFVLGFHDVSATAHDIGAGVTVAENPVIPAGMTAFYIVAAAYSSGYAATSVKPEVMNVMPATTVAGTQFGSTMTQGDWDALFPSAPSSLVSLTHATYPVGAKKGLVYRAVNAGSAPALPYGIAVGNGDYLAVDNATSGQEAFTVLATKGALTPLAAAISAVTAGAGVTTRRQERHLFFVKNSSATNPMTGDNVYDTFHDAYLAAAAVWDNNIKVIVIDDTVSGFAVEEPVGGYTYEMAINNIRVASLTAMTVGRKPAAGWPAQVIYWRARTNTLYLEGGYWVIEPNSFNAGYSIADGYSVNTDHGYVPALMTSDDTGMTVSPGAVNYNNGILISMGDRCTFYSSSIVGGSNAATIRMGSQANFTLDAFSFSSQQLYVNVNRDYSAVTKPTTGGNGGEYVSVNYNDDAGMLAFKSEILAAAEEARNIYYVGSQTVNVPAGRSYTSFALAVEAAAAIVAAVGGPVNLHVYDHAGLVTAINMIYKSLVDVNVIGHAEVVGAMPVLRMQNTGAIVDGSRGTFKGIKIEHVGGSPLFRDVAVFDTCRFDTMTSGTTGPIGTYTGTTPMRLKGSALFELKDGGTAFTGKVLYDDTNPEDGIQVSTPGPFMYVVLRSPDSSVPTIYSNYETQVNRYRSSFMDTPISAFTERGILQRGVPSPDLSAVYTALNKRAGVINYGTPLYGNLDLTVNNTDSFNGSYMVSPLSGTCVVSLPVSGQSAINVLAFFRNKEYNGWRASGPWLTINGTNPVGLMTYNGVTGTKVYTASFYHCDAVVLIRNNNDWYWLTIGADERPTDYDIWTVPTLSNSWATSVGLANVRWHVEGRHVIIDGSCEDGTAGLIFTLPAGYRPVVKKIFQVAAQDSGDVYVPAFVTVDTDGTVTLTSPSPSSHRVHLNGIRVLLGN